MYTNINYSFTSHPKDEAIMVKCLAQGHKRRHWPGRDSNPHSDNAPCVDGHLSGPFSSAELSIATSQLKCGKAHGPDNIPPEFLKHCSPKSLVWLRDFYSTCLTDLALPKIWRKSTVVALLKPYKPADDPKSYRPISLLCVPYKVLERLLLP